MEPRVSSKLVILVLITLLVKFISTISVVKLVLSFIIFLNHPKWLFCLEMYFSFLVAHLIINKDMKNKLTNINSSELL